MEIVEKSQSCIVVILWHTNTRYNELESDIDPEPILTLPMQVLCVSLEELFDETRTNSLEALRLFDQIYKDVDPSSPPKKHGAPADSPLIDSKHANDYIILKPNLFGVGVDLNALFRRIFWPKVEK